MDLNLTPDEEEFRTELRAWLKENLPDRWPETVGGSETDPEYLDYLRQWQQTVFAGGWSGIAWPKEYGGRGAGYIEQAILQEEMAAADAPPQIGVIGLSLVGPTIIAAGTNDQKEQHLSKILSGEDIWCQGFSEPNAGSDLASLSTSAVHDGDSLVVNGQKVWTSFAHIADWCLLLARTNQEATKHKGITCLLLDMKTPGIEVRPLRMMSGESVFNEVFFTDVRVPAANVLGEIDQGWGVALTALMNERANLGAGLYAMFRRTVDALVEHAKNMHRGGQPLATDSSVRQKLAQMHVELEIFRLNNLRALTRLMKTGMPGPEASIQKLYWSEYNQRLCQLAMEILGPQAQLKGFDGGRWAYNYLRARGNTIEAGTSEVQRNVIAQRVLGLPRSY